MKIILIILMSFITTSCTNLAFYAANVTVDYDAMQVQRDIIYDKEYDLKLDVYAPQSAESKAVIMYLFGGGWHSGSKSDYAFVAERFVKHGYTVVIPDYRLYPNVTYPDFVKDSAHALQWVHANYNEPLFLMGHSAGAYNAGMIAVNDNYAPNVEIAGLIGISGPYNFTPQEEKYQNIFNNMEDYRAIHINRYINDRAPAALLLHGKDDDTVSIRNTERFVEGLRRADVDVTAHYYENMGHYKIMAALTNPFEDNYSVDNDILAFMESRLKALD